MHFGYERNVDKCKIICSNAELELSHRLDERCRFDVTDGSTKLEHTVKQQEEDELLVKVTSIIQTSGSSSVPSTGIFEMRSIQSWIAFVT